MSRVLLYRNLISLAEGMQACMGQKAVLPSLIIFFSSLDTLGWLASDEEFATRESFLHWVDRYLLSSGDLACTSLDLYAARCGLLHTFTSGSRLSRSGQARQICWAWGSAPGEALEHAVDELDSRTYLALHIDDLHGAWQRGLEVFIEEVEQSPALARLVDAKAGRFYSELPPDFFGSPI